MRWLSPNKAVAHKWCGAGHINQLETDMQLLADLHMYSCPETRRHLLIALMDKKLTLGAVDNGS